MVRNEQLARNGRIRVAVDAMGGDYAPGEIVKGAVLAAQKDDIEIFLVGIRSVSMLWRPAIPSMRMTRQSMSFAANLIVPLLWPQG
jgi:fatty acid/phospholipid biosynthesis enzyme